MNPQPDLLPIDRTEPPKLERLRRDYAEAKSAYEESDTDETGKLELRYRGCEMRVADLERNEIKPK